MIRKMLLMCLFAVSLLALSGCDSDEVVIDEVNVDDTMWVTEDGDAWFYSSYDNMRNYLEMNIGAIRLDTYWYDFCPDYSVDNRVVRGIVFPEGIKSEDSGRTNVGGVHIYSAEQSYGPLTEVYTLEIFFVNDNGYMEKDAKYLEFVALEKLKYNKKYTCAESDIYFILDEDKTFTIFDGRLTISGQVIQKNRDLILKVSDDEYYVFIREIDEEGLVYSANRSYGDLYMPDNVWFYAE